MTPLWDVRWLGDDTYGRGGVPDREDFDNPPGGPTIIKADTAHTAALTAVGMWAAEDGEDYTRGDFIGVRQVMPVRVFVSRPGPDGLTEEEAGS